MREGASAFNPRALKALRSFHYAKHARSKPSFTFSMYFKRSLQNALLNNNYASSVTAHAFCNTKCRSICDVYLAVCSRPQKLNLSVTTEPLFYLLCSREQETSHKVQNPLPHILQEKARRKQRMTTMSSNGLTLITFVKCLVALEMTSWNRKNWPWNLKRHPRVVLNEHWCLKMYLKGSLLKTNNENVKEN